MTRKSIFLVLSAAGLGLAAAAMALRQEVDVPATAGLDGMRQQILEARRLLGTIDCPADTETADCH